jgi:S1-C subfamily serine protease
MLGAILFGLIATFMLVMHAMMGLSMRRYAKPKTVFKNARFYSLVGAIIMAPLLLVPGYQRLMAIPVVLGPWLAAVIATFPSRKKRLGQPQSNTMRFAQEAIAVVQIGHAMGNGFWVAPNRLVTCCHILVADMAGRLVAHTMNGRVELKVVSIDPTTDLVVLEPEGPFRAPVILRLAERTGDLKEGDPLVHTCYNNPSLLQPQWHEVEGTFKAKGTMVQLLAARRNIEKPPVMGPTHEMILANLVGEPGQSGSPVMNKNHEVIGALTGQGVEEGTAFLIPAESIHDALRSN